MISDAYVDFTCDECGTTEQVQLRVVYSSMAGRDPHADLRDSAIEEQMPDGWKARGGNKHYCESCDPDDA